MHTSSNSEDLNESEMTKIAIRPLPKFDPKVHQDKGYIGLNGETSQILVTDHFSRMKHSDTRVSKASSIEWLRNFLESHIPKCSGKCVFLDQGGELYNNPEIHCLFTRFGYDVCPTDADSSNQNGAVECGHGVVANAIRAMLFGVNLPVKFWPCAFHHWLRIDNVIPSKDQEHSPYFMVTGKKDDFLSYRTFGCRVWVCPPGCRTTKFVPNSRKGAFLGFLPNMDKNIVWHACFDEGMHDLPPNLVSPNVVHLQHTQDGQPLPAETQEASVQELTFTLHPLSHALTKGIMVTCNDPTLGITVGNDELNNWAYVADVKKNSSAANVFSSLKATLKKIKGAYITNNNNSKISIIRENYSQR